MKNKIKRSIAVFELSSSAHEKGLIALVKVVKKLGYEVTLITTRKTAERLQSHELSLFREVKCCSSIMSFIWAISSKRKHVAYVHHTVSVRATIITFLISMVHKNTVYFIRNCNSWLKYNLDTKYGVGALLARNMSTALKKLMLNERSLILVEKHTLREFLSTKVVNNIDVIPFGLTESICEHEYNDAVLEIVVPGIIDIKKKNLKVICEALQKLEPHIRSRYQLTLLGRPADEISLEFCESWKTELLESFRYFENFIKTEDFEKISSKAFVIVSSYFSNHRCSHLNEIYGTTKGSAVDAYATSNGIPLIVNQSYQVDDTFRDATLSFTDSSDLAAIFTKLAIDKKFSSHVLNVAKRSSRAFMLEEIVEKVSNLKEVLA
jgi:hypothetical protein